ncbi:MAG TPA: hypothetical protein DCL15_06865 [Chloroflexi bacterium]|nr:hypothetical protein [Chloroflexota bacterium]
MIGTVLLVVVSMLIWRMRTYAMMSIALPVLLLLYVGAIPWCRTVLPAVLLIALAYFGITGARINLEKSTEWQSGQIDITEFGNALTTIDWQAVTSKTMGDVSYRTAGLEGVASIIRAQELGWADTQQGKVLGAGFLQSLPLFLRPEFEIPERVKTAPSFLGIFLPGDWVTTFLAEFVLDYGIYALIVPGFFVGILIGLVDSGLLSLGIRPGLQGLLILRFPFLLYPVVFGTTVSDMIVTMFKGTLGFAVIFVVVSLWLSARSQLQRRNSHRHKETDVLVTRVLNV